MRLAKTKEEPGSKILYLALRRFSFILSRHTFIQYQTHNSLVYNILLQNKRNGVKTQCKYLWINFIFYYISKNQAALETSVVRSEPGRT